MTSINLLFGLNWKQSKQNSIFVYLVFIKFWYENIFSTFVNDCGMDNIPFITLEIPLNIGSLG